MRPVTDEPRDAREQAALLDLAYDAILVRELDTSIIRYWNQGAVTLYGWRKEEAIGQRTHDLLQTVLPQPLAEISMQLERTGHWEGELVHTTRDGRRVMVESRWSLYRGDDGQPVALEINRDVTARKKAEAAQARLLNQARAAETRAEQLIELAPDGLVLVNRQGRIMQVNRQVEVLFGYPRHELLGQPEEVLLPERLRAAHVARRAAYLAAPERRPMGIGIELFGRRKDGSEFPVEITLGPLDFDGEVIVTSLIRDITWRKQAEAERDALRAREQAARAEAERLKDEFLASVTHDLRTPVTAIKSSIEVVLANEPPETPTVLHRLLVNANQATDQMASLIDDLLELISLEAGQLSLDYQECDLRQIVRDAARAMEVLTRERRQRLDVVVPACPVRATVDPRRIERVLLNLLSNAHKYGREGGTIQVRVARRGADVVLTVADDGPGISAADQQRIFNRFYRVGASAATDPGSAARAQPQGLGLGLAIARNLVELHGGRLWVESAPGAGARFHVALPRRRQREAPPLPPD